jgi:hypothetical protein
MPLTDICLIGRGNLPSGPLPSRLSGLLFTPGVTSDFRVIIRPLVLFSLGRGHEIYDASDATLPEGNRRAPRVPGTFLTVLSGG